MPAWLINGVVMAIRRNEGTKHRRPASLDPYTQPGTHAISHTNQIQCKFFTLFCQTFVTQTTMSNYRIMVSLFHFYLSSFKFLPPCVHSLLLFFSHHVTVFQSSSFLVFWCTHFYVHIFIVRSALTKYWPNCQ